MRSMVIAVIAACALPGAGTAQQPDTTARIVGLIVDAQTGLPMEGVMLRLLTFDRPVQVTDRAGRFQFINLPRGVHEIEAEQLGYGRGSQLINVPAGGRVDIRVALSPSAIVLDSLVITTAARMSRLERVGFLRRQKRGWGYFFRDKDASAWHITQIVRRVPRMEIRQGGDSPNGTRVVIRQARGACIPSIWIDGFNQRWANGDIEAAVGGLDIEAIEIYRGLDTPVEFYSGLGMRPCGAIVVWTRR